MCRSWLLAIAATGVVGSVVAIPRPVPAQEKKPDDKDMKKKTEQAIERGLEWLKKTQAQDGHWEAQGGQYPTTMTALAGMCFLMEGSTLKEGKYSDQVQKAVNWFLAANRQSAKGCLGNLQNPTESSRYLYGHGFGTMFLASVYGEEEDKDQREKLEDSQEGSRVHRTSRRRARSTARRKARRSMSAVGHYAPKTAATSTKAR